MKKKTPLTFEQATLKAASYVGRQEKLRSLLEVASSKSKRYYESLLAPWESLQIFISHDPRLGVRRVPRTSRLGSHGSRRRHLFRESV
jgi:hypothetical protein